MKRSTCDNMEERELYLRVDDEDDDRELDVRALIFSVARKWRQMIIWGILCALALGGLKYFKEYRSYNSTVEEGHIEDIEKTLTEKQNSEISIYLAFYDRQNVYKEEMGQRILYKLDPYNKHVLSLNYIVNVTEDLVVGDDAILSISKENRNGRVMSGLAGAYTSHMTGSALIEEIMKTQSKISENDIRSLITAKYENSVITFELVYTEDMDIESIADAIKKDVENFSKEQQKIVKHELVLVDETHKVVVDNDLVRLQNDMVTQIYDIQNRMNGLENNFDDTEKEYIRLYLKGDEEEKSVDTSISEEAAPSVSKKMVLAGFIVGVMLVCMWEFMRFVFSGKLQSVDDLAEYYKLRIFGVQDAEKEKKAPKGIDKFIFNIENRNRKQLAYDEQKEIILSGISLYCEQNEVKKLILTGTDIENVSGEYLSELKAGLAKKGIETEVEKNIFYYPEALQSSIKVANVIIFETIGSSIEKEVDNLLLKAKEYNINVMGAVALV